MAVSQKQIAERVGVSIALVSRVLSGRAREVGIAEATIARVLAAAEEMGYVPSAAALTLKGKSSRTMGVVVYDFRDPFFGTVIEQLQGLAHGQGYSLVLAGFKGRHPEESDLAPLHKHAIDGLIILGSADRSEWLEGFSGMPVARIGHGAPDECSVRIAVDEADAARQLVDHLRSRGCGACAYVGEPLFAHALRFRALEQAAAGLGLSVERRTPASPDLAEGDAALVCATDTIAMEMLRLLHDAGRTRPVTGFDDIPSAARFIPPITTVRQPVEEMAKQAFRAVAEGAGPREVLLRGWLVARGST